MYRRLGPVALVGVALILVGCQGDTDPAIDVGATTAKLNGTGRCTEQNGEHGEVFFQYQRVGASSWSDAPHRRFDCDSPTGDVPLSEPVTGLDAGSHYRFRLAVDFDPQGTGPDAWADANGTVNGNNYDTFKTLELAIPRGAVDGFGQAGDFYDSVGVNVHFAYTDTTYWPNANVIADLAELGVRHIRDGSAGSWYDFRFQFMRPGWIAMRNRNRGLPVPSATDQGQPLFLTTMTSGWGPSRFATQQQRNAFGIGAAYTLDDWFQQFDGGHQHYDGNAGPNEDIPGVGSAIPNGTTSNPNAPVPNPWAFSDPELPWEIVAGLLGPNEPGGIQFTDPAWTELEPWLRGMLARKNARSGPALGANRYITPSGMQQGPAKVNQLPMGGIVVMDGGLPGEYGWDWSKGTEVVDLGDMHPYHTAHEPSQEYVTRSIFNTNQTDPYMGRERVPADPSKAIPLMITEFGHISRGVDSAIQAKNVGAHSGYWPAPDDVIAEYIVRTYLLFYMRGIRRTFYYELYDEKNEPGAAEQNFGLLRYNRTKKEQFYALRNLLKLVGFSEASPAQRTKLNISVSGFVPQGNNRHIAKYAGIGDPGPVPAGGVYHENADRLDTLQLQQDADTYLVFLVRQASLWDREPGNWNTATNQIQSLADIAAGRSTPNTQNLTVHLPAGVQSVSVAQPTAGGASSPNDGQAFAPLAINNNSVAVPISGKTKVLKVQMAP